MATIKKTNYDVEKTVKELQNTSLPKKSVGRLISMLVVGGIVNLEIDNNKSTHDM